MRAFVRWISPDAIECWWPYDAIVLAEFKAAVPSRFRGWDPERKVWTVRWPHANAAIDLLAEWFDDLRVEELPKPPPPPPPPHPGPRKDDPYAALHLLGSAPRPVVDAAYRALARLHHPDTGGDTATMQRVNTAYQRIRERLG